MRVEDMTWAEVNDLLGQIGVVSTLFAIKQTLGGMFINNYKSGTEFEEFESKEDQAESELKRIQYLAGQAGIKKPKGWAE